MYLSLLSFVFLVQERELAAISANCLLSLANFAQISNSSANYLTSEDRAKFFLVTAVCLAVISIQIVLR
jgi:hypothetical protein